MTPTALHEILEESLICLSDAEAALSGLVRFAGAVDDSIAHQFRALILPHLGGVQQAMGNINTAITMTEKMQ